MNVHPNSEGEQNGINLRYINPSLPYKFQELTWRPHLPPGVSAVVCLGYTLGRIRPRRPSWVVFHTWLKKKSLKIQKIDHHHATASALTSAGHLKSNECTEFSSAVTGFLLDLLSPHSKQRRSLVSTLGAFGMEVH